MEYSILSGNAGDKAGTMPFVTRKQEQRDA